MADDRVDLTPESEGWMRKWPASAAVRAGDLLFLSGQASVADSGRPLDAGDAAKQLRNAFARIRAVLRAAGAEVDDVLDVMTFHKDPRTIDDAFAVGRKVFAPPYPARTTTSRRGSWAPTMPSAVHAG